MKRKVWGLVLVALAVVGGGIGWQRFGSDYFRNAASAQTAPPPAKASPPQRVVPVTVGKAIAKEVPLDVDSIGTVQAVATVTLRTRVEAQVSEVLVEDGARVRKGDVILRLDARSIDAQIRQAEALVQRDTVLLDQARRTVKRQEDLQQREVGARTLLEDSRSAASAAEATLASDQAQLELLRVQRTYYTIQAPIDGRIGSVGLKVGNIAKTGDSTTPIGTINQFQPIYVAFPVPQRHIVALRQAIATGTAVVNVRPQGLDHVVKGKVAFVDNSFDPASGTISVRALFDNGDEQLWPGTLCTVKVTLRMEPGVTVPREAVQSSQKGSFVYVVEDGAAKVRPVEIARLLENEAVVLSGLSGGETVVTDGQLQLTNGVKVQPRNGGAS